MIISAATFKLVAIGNKENLEIQDIKRSEVRGVTCTTCVVMMSDCALMHDGLTESSPQSSILSGNSSAPPNPTVCIHLLPFRRGSIASSPTSGVVATNSAVLLLCWVLDRTTHRNLDFLNRGQTDKKSPCLEGHMTTPTGIFVPLGNRGGAILRAPQEHEQST
jgi:hypothetical protein